MLNPTEKPRPRIGLGWVVLLAPLGLGIAHCQQADKGDASEQASALQQQGGIAGEAAADAADTKVKVDFCGGLIGAGCDKGEYCDFPLEASCGAGDQTGSCEPIPDACTKIYMPVCGCDDMTYDNACVAHSHGVSVAAEGACDGEPIPEDPKGDCDSDDGRACGGLLGLACEKDEFCDFAPNAFCGAADQTGVCRPRPDACTKIYMPVCGCDGETYGNACEANGAGVSVASEGECGDEPSGDACGGLLGLSCEEGEFCNYAPDALCGAADATGICTPQPDVCPEIFMPVCGCDGETYDNACFANAAGTSVVSEGRCSGSSGQICGTRGAEPCADDEFCSFPEGAMCGATDKPGTCVQKADIDCPQDKDPVCGCDGETYLNECEAMAAFTSVASRGACGGGCDYNGEHFNVGDGFPADDGCNDCSCAEDGSVVCTLRLCPPIDEGATCGGLLGAGCESGQFCDFPVSASCGAADQTGMCRDIPRGCTREFQPVCGCDDVTYDNACLAASKGVSVATTSPCKAP